MLYGVGGVIYFLWLWNKREKLHNDFRFQFQGFSGFLGYKLPQTKNRWRIGIILSVIFYCVLSIAALLFFMFGDFNHSNEPLPWFLTGPLVMIVILYCAMFAYWCSIIASYKNREPKGSMLLGALLGPIGLIISILHPAR